MLNIRDFHSSDADDQSLWNITMCYGVDSS